MIKLFEKFKEIDEIKDIIFIKAIETDNTNVIDFFLNKGYDINSGDVLTDSSYNDNTLRHLLSKGIDVESYRESSTFLRDLDNQKALIDYGYDYLIYSTVGFNYRLKDDPKYADNIKRLEDADKYNM